MMHDTNSLNDMDLISPKMKVAGIRFDARRTGPVNVATLEGVLCPAVIYFGGNDDHHDDQALKLYPILSG